MSPACLLQFHVHMHPGVTARLASSRFIWIYIPMVQAESQKELIWCRAGAQKRHHRGEAENHLLLASRRKDFVWKPHLNGRLSNRYDKLCGTTSSQFQGDYHPSNNTGAIPSCRTTHPWNISLARTKTTANHSSQLRKILPTVFHPSNDLVFLQPEESRTGAASLLL